MLAKIAAEMQNFAQTHPRLKAEEIKTYQRQLSGGLMVTLFLDGQHTWHLSLSREGKAPSATEIKVIKSTFSVPDAAGQEESTTGKWRIVRLTWKEASQKPLFEVNPVEQTGAYYKETD